MNTLYEALEEAGVSLDHHESDLYALKTEESEKILHDYGQNAHLFISRIDGKAWYDIPFAYQPFWERKA